MRNQMILMRDSQHCARECLPLNRFVEQSKGPSELAILLFAGKNQFRRIGLGVHDCEEKFQKQNSRKSRTRV
jgi:hypothetical protein